MFSEYIIRIMLKDYYCSLENIRSAYSGYLGLMLTK